MTTTLRPRLGSAATALLLALVAMPSVGAPAAHAAEETYTVPSDRLIDVTGRGNGHGRGMSQWGAKARAEAGHSADQILSAYYPGTASTNQDNPALRIVLTNLGAEGITSGTGRFQCDYARTSAHENCGMEVLPDPRLHVSRLSGGAATELPSSLGGRLVTAWGISPRSDGAAVQLMANAGGWQAWGSADTRGYAFSRGNSPVNLRYRNGVVRGYPGTVDAIRTGATRIARVNVTYTETYLRGVVPHEMPASWSPAAVQTQAVAARTYAAFLREESTSASWDLCDSTSCQVYHGTATHPASDDAVRETSGRIRTSGGQPAFTQFSASNGGYSVAGSFSYLAANPDTFDRAEYPEWSFAIPASTVESRYPALGRLQRIVLVSRDGRGDYGGRVLEMRLEGASAGRTFNGDSQIRSALGLRSSMFRLPVSAPADSDPLDRFGAAATGAGSALLVSRAFAGEPAARAWSDAGGLGGPAALGGETAFAPAVVMRPDNRADALVVGTNGALYMNSRSPGGTWSGWARIDGTADLSGRPGAVALSNGYLDVFVPGDDGAVRQLWRRPDGTWSGMQSVGGAVAAGSGVSAAELGDGREVIVVQGTDRAAWARIRTSATGGWTGWIGLGGTVVADPSVAAPAHGSASVVVRGSDDAVWTSALTPSGPGRWQSLGGQLDGAPVIVAVTGSRRADLLARGTHGELSHRRWLGAWSAWGPA